MSTILKGFPIIFVEITHSKNVLFLFPVHKPKHADSPQEQCNMLMDGIWDLIYNSRKHIWHQLHTLNGTVVNLVDPPKEWKFLSSGKYFKINVKVGKCLKHFFPLLYRG